MNDHNQSAAMVSDAYADCMDFGRLSQLTDEIELAIASAVQAEREACAWHEENAIKFYDERIEWCSNHPGNDAARITSQYARDSHAGVLAAILARSNNGAG